MTVVSNPEVEAEPGAKDSFLNRFLGVIEKAGNILPHPATLFVILAVLVIVFSAITSALARARL